MVGLWHVFSESTWETCIKIRLWKIQTFLFIYSHFSTKKEAFFWLWPPVASAPFWVVQLRRRKLSRSDSFKHVAAEKKIIRTRKFKHYFCKWYLSFFHVCVSIFYFSTCLQREAGKKGFAWPFCGCRGKGVICVWCYETDAAGETTPEGAILPGGGNSWDPSASFSVSPLCCAVESGPL